MFGFSPKRPQKHERLSTKDAKELWALKLFLDIILEHRLPFPQKDERTFAAATVASFIINEAIRKNCWESEKLDERQEFAALIMSFVVSDYCSRIVGSDFVRVHLLAMMNIFHDRRGATLGSLIREGSLEYHNLVADPEQYQIIYSIGQNTADWINHRDSDMLDRLAGLLGLMAQAVV